MTRIPIADTPSGLDDRLSITEPVIRGNCEHDDGPQVSAGDKTVIQSWPAKIREVR